MVRFRKYTIAKNKEVVLHIYCDSDIQALALASVLYRKVIPVIEELAKEIKA